MLERYFTPYQTSTAILGNRVAILAPHPDDEIFGCGASACKWVEQGATVQAFIITSGVVQGEYGDQPESEKKRRDKAEQRAQESRDAAKLLGLAEPQFLERQDGELLDDLDIELLLLEKLEAFQPTTIVAPSIWEMHRDHRAVAQLGLRLVQQLESVKQIALYEVGMPLKPNVMEDISAYQTRKWQAMQCFPSQLETQHYAEQIRGLNCYRAYTLGLDVTSAEAFHCIPAQQIVEFIQQHAPESATLALREAEQIQAHQSAHIQQQQRRIHELEYLLHQTHQTLSWRITKPLRWLRSRI